MCGRYQFSVKYEELQEIVRSVEKRCGRSGLNFPPAGEIYPKTKVPVLIADGGRVVGDLQTWGIPGWRGGLVINARAETVQEKPMFRQSIRTRRCVVPTTGFYEWDQARSKYYFRLPDKPLYLAGIYDNVNGGNCFVILTTRPNACMQEIHDRMPLVIAREQIRAWLTDPVLALQMLDSTPPLLERSRSDGQISFSDL